MKKVDVTNPVRRADCVGMERAWLGGFGVRPGEFNRVFQFNARSIKADALGEESGLKIQTPSFFHNASLAARFTPVLSG